MNSAHEENKFASRRGILAGLAIAPFVAVPSLAIVKVSPDSELFAIETALAELEPRLDAAMNAFNRAESAVLSWKRRNPKPKMRECHVGTGAEYEIWFKQMAEVDDPADVTAPDPNGDLKAAMREHEEQLQEWSRRLRAAKANCNIEAANAAWAAVGSEQSKLCERARNIKATTLPGLICKARICHNDDCDYGIAETIVDDLLDLDPAKAA